MNKIFSGNKNYQHKQKRQNERIFYILMDATDGVPFLFLSQIFRFFPKINHQCCSRLFIPLQKRNKLKQIINNDAFNLGWHFAVIDDLNHPDRIRFQRDFFCRNVLIAAK